METTTSKRREGDGAKYDPARPLAEIKRCVIADVAAAVKAGEIPAASYKVSAAKSRGSMCHPHVLITVGALPFTALHPGKLATVRQDGNDNRYQGPWLSDEAVALSRKLRGLVAAYAYDRSDTMTDHFDYSLNIDVTWADMRAEHDAALAAYQASQVAS
jgi:hypothetical protein